jgi:hypothetical protein
MPDVKNDVEEDVTVDVNPEEVEETEAVEGEPEKPKKPRTRYNVSAEEFVRVWQSSDSAQEAADRLGMPKSIVLARSAVYRKARADGSPGINLKRMPRNNPRKLDTEYLRKVAAECGPVDEPETQETETKTETES